MEGIGIAIWQIRQISFLKSTLLCRLFYLIIVMRAHSFKQGSEENCSSSSSLFMHNNHASRHQKRMEAFDEHKRPPKRQISIVQQKKKNGGSKRRDNNLHHKLFLPNGLPDGAELAYCVKGEKLLAGYKQGKGIVCNCCNKEISPSQFEAHAGMASRRQPYRHIYMNGFTLHDIARSLANGKSITTVRSEESEIGGCAICRAPTFSPKDEGFNDRTVIFCDQCEREFHVGCLRECGNCDLKRIPEDRWFCSNDCNQIYVALRNSVSSGAQMVPALQINVISRKHAEKGLHFEGSTDDFQWRILMGKGHSDDDAPLLSAACAIFRDCFDPIVTESGRDLIPCLVYGGDHIRDSDGEDGEVQQRVKGRPKKCSSSRKKAAAKDENNSDQEYRGMYCIVLLVKNIVVSAGILRSFGREVAELPLVATSKEHQGKGYFQALFSCVERFLCNLNVVNLVLPAAEEAESFWISRFGFRKLSEAEVSKYMMELPLTEFKGTSMLQKAVPQQTID